MKIFERNANRDMVEVNRELSKEISETQKKCGLRWRSAVKAKLRKRYRTRENAVIRLSALGLSDRDLPVIKASVLAQGSIQKRYNTCGKKDCPCSRDPRKRHGPYYYLSLPMPMYMVNEGSPRMKHFYLSESEVEELRSRISTYRMLVEKAWLDIYDEFEKGTDIDDYVVAIGGKKVSRK